MPTYEFECDKCGKGEDAFLKVSDYMKIVKKGYPCKCGGQLHRVYNTPPQRGIVEGGTDRAIAFDRHSDRAAEAMQHWEMQKATGDISAQEVRELKEIEEEESKKRGKAPPTARKPLRTITDINAFKSKAKLEVSKRRSLRR
jgi:putative FmdB family regulatory protein